MRLLIAALIAAGGALGADPAVEFNRDIRPILSENCFSCHGPDASKRAANLRLDEEASAKTKIAPGDPAASELIRRAKAG